MNPTPRARLSAAAALALAAVGGWAGAAGKQPPCRGQPKLTLQGFLDAHLGTVTDDEPRRVTFRFKNTGDAPLVITSARSDEPSVLDTLRDTFGPIGPVIAWDSQSVDFGVITDEAPHAHAFTFTNVGDEPLEVDYRPHSPSGSMPVWHKPVVAHPALNPDVQVHPIQGPCIEFETTRVYLGCLNDDTPRTIRFRFKNIGSATLQLGVPHYRPGGVIVRGVPDEPDQR